jgi:hypothetical protein
MKLSLKEQIRWLLILITFLNLRCKSTNGQQHCLEDNIKEIKATSEYNSIRSAARDTISKWATLNIKTFYGINRTEWELDSAVFFNKDKSKALLLLLEVDTVLTAKLDYIKLLAAEKKGDNWYFYAQSMHFIIYDREENPQGRPYTFPELSLKGRYELIRGGYFKIGSCNVNYAYVDNWFKEPLAEYHQYFLHNRVEK